MELPYLSFASPLGWLVAVGNEAGIHELRFSEDDEGCAEAVPACLDECRRQVEAYFEGELTKFDLPLAPQGTDFQVRVWNALLGIPFGVTKSYADVAIALQNLKAIRAVGAANGQNKIAIIVPCHRVIGSSGDLTGYAGGLWRKKWLLEHERKAIYGLQGQLF